LQQKPNIKSSDKGLINNNNVRSDIQSIEIFIGKLEFLGRKLGEKETIEQAISDARSYMGDVPKVDSGISKESFEKVAEKLAQYKRTFKTIDTALLDIEKVQDLKDKLEKAQYSLENVVYDSTVQEVNDRITDLLAGSTTELESIPKENTSSAEIE